MDNGKEIGKNNSLFPSLFLPNAYDGELLYSWGARFHRLSGNQSARETSRQLFSNSTAGLRHDFYGCLDEFQRKTDGLLGTAEEIIHQRSLASFYFPFISFESESKFRQMVLQGTGASARQLLRLFRSGLSTPPLKACPNCIQEDLKQYPTAWWRTRQQWPTSFVCPQHRRPLMVWEAESRRSALADWYLPDFDSRQSWKDYRIVQDKTFELLLRLDQWAVALTGDSTLRYESKLLRHTYLLQARNLGWLSPDGSVRLLKLRDAFFEQHISLLDEPVFNFIRGAQEDHFGFLGLLLRQYPGHRHPLLHYFLMAFLFPEPSDFLRSYREVITLWKAGGQCALSDQLSETYSHLRSLVANAGYSVTSAAKILEINITQATRHLENNKVDFQRRPRIVGTDTEKQLIEMLKRGECRRQIAQILGIRSAFIKDYLAKQPELKERWEGAYFVRKREEHRCQLLKIIEAFPTMPIRRIRRIPGNGFQWLHNNDRDWLKLQLPAIWNK